MKTILVATDFSKSADNACKYAVALAKDFKATVYLLNVFQVTDLYDLVGTLEYDYKYLYDTAAIKLNSYHSKLKRSAGGVTIIPLLEMGSPSARVCAVAKEKKCDLIVIGEKGRSFRESVLFGTNAWRIIRDAPCMTLAVPHRARYKPVKKMIYTTDLAKDNLSRVKNIIPLAEKFKSGITLLNINQKIVKQKKEFEKLINKLANKLKYKKITGASVVSPDVSEGIQLFIKKHKAEWLVMFTRKKNFFDLLAGKKSATKRMIYYSTIPMLVLHEKDTVTRTKKKTRVVRVPESSSPSELTFNP